MLSAAEILYQKIRLSYSLVLFAWVSKNAYRKRT